MKLGILGFCTDSGLGYEFRDALRNLPVQCAFAMPNAIKPTRPEELSKVPHVIASGNLNVQMEQFLRQHKPDVLLSWEFPGSWKFPGLFRKHGVRWAHVIHWDWFWPRNSVWRAGWDRLFRRNSVWRDADMLIAPNTQCQEKLKNYDLKTTLLPIPIDTNRFRFEPRTRAERFICIAGFGGCASRRGLPELFEAWRQLPQAPPLSIFAQLATSEYRTLPPGVTVDISSVSDPINLYRKGDVAIQVSRYEGVGLTLMEAQSCGLPTITVDGPPMNWLANQLVIPRSRVDRVQVAGKKIEAFVVDPEKLANGVAELAGRDISRESAAARRRMEEEFSWDCLREKWINTLSSTMR